jgi:hypothetical protein
MKLPALLLYISKLFVGNATIRFFIVPAAFSLL